MCCVLHFFQAALLLEGQALRLLLLCEDSSLFQTSQLLCCSLVRLPLLLKGSSLCQLTLPLLGS